MDHLPAGPVTLMIAGAVLAVVGFARRNRPPAPCRPNQARRLLRLVWDLTAGLLYLVVFSAMVLSPRNSVPPRRLSMRDALAGRSSARRSGKAKR